MRESKPHFSGKHHLYGYKMELSIRVNGLAALCSKHYPGAVHDIQIFQDRIATHKKRLLKHDDDKDIAESDLGSAEYPTYWAILADKGYEGADEMTRAITPYKKPIRGVLSAEKEDFNRKLSSDRILVENYFGSMVNYWNIMSRKYQWSEDLYDTIASVCVSLTNCLVDYNPLRTDDGDWYSRYKNRLSSVGQEKKR